MTVAKVDDKVRLQSVETWFDPLEMFRQIAPNGIVNKTIVTAMSELDVSAEPSGSDEESYKERKAAVGSSSGGNAIVEAGDSETTLQVHAEMSRITPTECTFLMNKE